MIVRTTALSLCVVYVCIYRCICAYDCVYALVCVCCTVSVSTYWNGDPLIRRCIVGELSLVCSSCCALKHYRVSEGHKSLNGSE